MSQDSGCLQCIQTAPINKIIINRNFFIFTASQYSFLLILLHCYLWRYEGFCPSRLINHIFRRLCNLCIFKIIFIPAYEQIALIIIISSGISMPSMSTSINFAPVKKYAVTNFNSSFKSLCSELLYTFKLSASIFPVRFSSFS